MKHDILKNIVDSSKLVELHSGNLKSTHYDIAFLERVRLLNPKNMKIRTALIPIKDITDEMRIFIFKALQLTMKPVYTEDVETIYGNIWQIFMDVIMYQDFNPDTLDIYPENIEQSIYVLSELDYDLINGNKDLKELVDKTDIYEVLFKTASIFIPKLLKRIKMYTEDLSTVIPMENDDEMLLINILEG